MAIASGMVMFLSSRNDATGNYVYAIIHVDKSLQDRPLINSLKKAGFQNPIGESTQTVLLDDFESLKPIPLDEYNNLIEPFDPRNDGYAAKLRSLFIKGSDRRIYLDQSSLKQPINAGSLRRRVSKALAGEHFSLEFGGGTRKSPPLSPIFALSSLLGALGSILKEPLAEFFTVMRLGFKDRFLAFRGSWILAGTFFAAYIAAGLFSPLSIPVFLGGLILFCVFVLIYTFWKAKQERTRFLRMAGFSAPKNLQFIMLPFIAASFICFGLSFLSPASGLHQSFAGKEGLVSSEDYEKHLTFQRTFSFKALPGPFRNVEKAPDYLHYTLGNDGLIAPHTQPPLPDERTLPEAAEAPAFPLTGLMAELHGAGAVAGEMPASAFLVGRLIPLLIACALALPFFFVKKQPQGHSKKGGFSVYMNRRKRIAA
jgi:hypothetical protein